MREYPHGLDEEILPEDLETEQGLIIRLQPFLEQAYIERKSSLFKGLGKCYYAVGCISYALGEPTAKINEPLGKALEYLYNAFEMDIPLTAYDFIRLLSLSVVLGNSDIAQVLARTKRTRYTNENVEVEEITFAVAGLMSAFVREDEKSIAKILAENSSDKIDTNKIFRHDRLLYFPLFRLLEAVHRKDSAMFERRMQARQTDFVKLFSRAPRKNDPDALIDMPGLAIAAFAGKNGINVTDTSVYRPYDLIRER